MWYWFFKHFSFGRQKKEGFNKALTLIELLLTVAIVGTLAGIAVPLYFGHVEKQRIATASVDISNIESQIGRWMVMNGRPPNNFAEAGIPASNDPWGNPYSYLRIQGISPMPLVRRDKLTKPLNDDYDLYSSGRDGASAIQLDAGISRDDIVRANNGAFIGLASEY